MRASTAQSTGGRILGGRIASLLRSLCGGEHKRRLEGANSRWPSKVVRNEQVRTPPCTQLADPGALLLAQLLTTGGSHDAELCLSTHRAYSASEIGPLSMLEHAHCRLRSTHASASCSFLSSQLLSLADSVWFSQSSSGAETSPVMSTHNTGFLQLCMPPPTTQAYACEIQATSHPTRPLSNFESKASTLSMQGTEHSAVLATSIGDQPEIPHAYPGCSSLDNQCSNNPGIIEYYLMQPYEEEKHSWLQTKWQQQQDWLEQQQQMDPFSPRTLLRQGSKSLNVRAARQSGMLLVSGDIEQARNGQLSLMSSWEEM